MKNPPEVVITAASVLSTLRNGVGNTLATIELEKMILAVKRAKKAGAINVKFIVELMADGEGEVDIYFEISSQFPKIKTAKGVFYADDQGHLLPTDPRQLSLDQHFARIEAEQRERMDKAPPVTTK
jgi:hypothetical protein